MKLYHRKLGEGPPLIIVHGLYGMSDNWMTVAREVSPHFTVWLPDLRNHGRSPHDPKIDFDSMKDDLVEFMDEHGIEKASILGHSMGGKVVMHLAESAPERFTAMIVVDVSPRAYSAESRSNGETIDHATIIESMMSIDTTRAKNLGEIETQLSWYIPSARVRKFLLKNIHRDKQGHYQWTLNLKVLLDALPDLFSGIDVKKYEGGRGITGFPVLFVRGEKSAYIGEEDHALIRKVFPDAEITTIPNAGHWLHAEQPALLVKTILYFLKIE